jgi:hypothetical protein
LQGEGTAKSLDITLEEVLGKLRGVLVLGGRGTKEGLRIPEIEINVRQFLDLLGVLLEPGGLVDEGNVVLPEPRGTLLRFGRAGPLLASDKHKEE